MRFEWDETKNRKNRLKHHVSFETAMQVFEDPNALSLMDRMVDNEERWQTLGRVRGIVILIVAHTVREREGDQIVRIISARKATPCERRAYEDQESQAR